MTFNPNISLFPSARSNTPDKHGHLLSFLELIRLEHSSHRSAVDNIRNTEDKKKRSGYKKALPAVTFSGTFSIRNADSLLEYSQVICLDIDDLEDVQEVKYRIIDDPYLMSAFVSPSGSGLKLLFQTETAPSQHLDLFLSLENYIKKQYGLTADPSGKDVSRLCFLSYDPDIYITSENVVIDDKFIKHHFPIEETAPGAAPAKTKRVPPPAPLPNPDLPGKIDSIVRKTVTPGDGFYNAYINNYAIQANRYALSIDATAWAICSFCGWAAPDKEDIAVIKSVYSKFASEHGKYLTPTKQPAQQVQGTYTDPHHAKEIPLTNHVRKNEYNEDVQFWYKVEKFDKSSGEIIEGREEYRFSYDDAIIFLENNGFFKLKSGESYHFIHVDRIRQIVSLTPVLRIKEYMIDYLKNNDSMEFKKVREMFRRGAKNYCSVNLLEGLEYRNPDFKRDTKTAAYVYFKNGYCEITAAGISQNDYTEQEGFIWEKQILDINYEDIDYTRCDANRFIWYVATGRKCEDYNQYTEVEHQKYRSMCTTLGYLLHSYKSPIVTKAVVSVDRKLRVGSEDNGGSGKSLFIQLVSKMVKTCRIDAKNFKFDAAFPFQKVDIDTRIIDFDDVRPNFDFSRLFSMITSEFSFEKKGMPLITIPFEDAPKHYISTNKSIKSDGVSSSRRQQVIEFSTYFSENRTVAMEFGRMFFFDWDNEEWQRYYCFMLNCLQMYLEHGLIAFPLENYELNKLIDTAGEEFVDYMDEIVKDGLFMGSIKMDSTALFDKYIEKVKPKYGLKKNTFTKWVRMWAELSEMHINQHINGGRDRSNGTDYWTFTLKSDPAPGDSAAPAQNEIFNPENDVI